MFTRMLASCAVFLSSMAAFGQIQYNILAVDQVMPDGTVLVHFFYERLPEATLLSSITQFRVEFDPNVLVPDPPHRQSTNLITWYNSVLSPTNTEPGLFVITFGSAQTGISTCDDFRNDGNPTDCQNPLYVGSLRFKAAESAEVGDFSVIDLFGENATTRLGDGVIVEAFDGLVTITEDLTTSIAPADVRGRIVDSSTGDGVPCAIAEFSNEGRTVVELVIADENGVFFIPSIAAGTYNVLISGPNFNDIAGPEAVVSAKGVTNFEYSLQLDAAQTNVSGTVTDAVDGRPIVGALVEAQVDSQVIARTYTCSDGRYALHIDGLGGEQVTYSYTADGYNIDSENRIFTVGTPATVNVTGSRLAEFTSVLSGYTYTDVHEPEIITGARLTLLGGPISTSTTTNADGAYVFNGLPAGTYRAVASATGHYGREMTQEISANSDIFRGFALLPGEEPDVESDPIITREPADLDGNGLVESVDIQLVINATLGVAIVPTSDVNGDGIINAADIQLVINTVLGII